MEHEASIARSDLEQMLIDETIEPKALPLSLLKAITDDFSDDREIGRGGFAVVYKGILDNRSVAVKKLSRAYMHETEFDREIACLTRAKHKNVVRFLGYCDDRQRSAETYDGKLIMADVQQRLLCFEYIHNGSLDLYIKDAHRDWDTCYKIIKGICHGLQYLHDNRIIHLDLKPANILLDNDMVPKITDFGLSRCLDENQSQVLTRNILGTTGYLAPERFEGSGIARSGDLYSLGIIIMEILTGQKGHQTSEDVLESWSGRLEKSLQDTLYEQIRVCYEIALNCIQFNPKDRPASARDIIDRLHKMESIQGWFGEILNFSPDPAQLPDPPANLSPGGAATKKASTDDMLEQMSHLCVSVVKARDLPTMNTTGSLDPYVEVKLGDFKGMTRQLKKKANPVWRQMFTFSAAHLKSNQLQIIVKHKDMFRDDFVGRVFFDMSDIPSRLSPDSRLAPQWYHLSDTHGENSHSLGEVMLAVWLGTQADKSYMEAWHSDAHAFSMGRIANTRSKVYYTPNLICLKVSVLAAQDLKGPEKDQPLGPTTAKVEMGSQMKLTRTGQPHGSANPAWNEELMFVVSQPFENPLVVTVVENVGAGREEPIGRVIIPMSSPYELRNDLADDMSVPFEWFSLSDGMTGSKIQLRISLDTSYHVMAEWTEYMSDLHPAAAF